jgi:hypothetical protein
MADSIILGDWTDTTPDAVFDEFHVPAADREGITILLAGYEIDGYEGSAMVLFTKDNKLWEVHGSHCSCMGLEDQWQPKEVTTTMLRANLARDSYEYRPVKTQLTTILDDLDSRR